MFLTSASFALIASSITSVIAQTPQPTQAAPTSLATSVGQSGASGAAPPAPTGRLIQIPFVGGTGTDNSTYVGSLIGVQSALTTVAVGCPQGQEDLCIFQPPWTYTFGPSSVRNEASIFIRDGDPPLTTDCKLGPDGWVCSAQGILINNDGRFTTTKTDTVPATQVPSLNVLVTAGATADLKGNAAAGFSMRRPGSFAAALMGFAVMYF